MLRCCKNTVRRQGAAAALDPCQRDSAAEGNALHMLLLLGMQPLHTEQQIKCILGTTSLVACVLHCARQPTLKIITVCSNGASSDPPVGCAQRWQLPVARVYQ